MTKSPFWVTLSSHDIYYEKIDISIGSPLPGNDSLMGRRRDVDDKRHRQGPGEADEKARAETFSKRNLQCGRRGGHDFGRRSLSRLRMHRQRDFGCRSRHH